MCWKPLLAGSLVRRVGVTRAAFHVSDAATCRAGWPLPRRTRLGCCCPDASSRRADIGRATFPVRDVATLTRYSRLPVSDGSCMIQAAQQPGRATHGHTGERRCLGCERSRVAVRPGARACLRWVHCLRPHWPGITSSWGGGRVAGRHGRYLWSLENEGQRRICSSRDRHSTAASSRSLP